MARSSAFSKSLLSMVCIMAMVVASCGFGANETATNTPPTPLAKPIGIPAEANRLRITLTDIEITPDGRLRFWIYAQNWSPDAKVLPVENFVATDEATGITYRADGRESRWIGNVAASYGGEGQITLERPLPAMVKSLRLSFSGMAGSNDLAIQAVPITHHPPLGIDLNLTSPFVDGLQLTVKRVEVSDGVVKVTVQARHMDIGLDPFGPQVYEYKGDAIRKEKAEVEAREWRTLQSKEFTFQDEQGRTYTVDGGRSKWDTEVVPNGLFQGFLTISNTLESSVSQLRLIYADVYHSAHVALAIEHIPVPQVGSTDAPSQPNNPMAECSFITGSPQLTEAGKTEQRLTDMKLGSQSLYESEVEYAVNPTHMYSLISPSPTPITPISGTWAVSVQSNETCGLILKAQHISRDTYGVITLGMQLINEDLPYNLSLAGLSIKVTDYQGRNLIAYTPTGMDKINSTGEIRNKSDYPFDISLFQLPTDVTKINIALTLPGKQVLTIAGIALP